MKLSQKGSFVSPPKLRGHAQRVAETITAWEGILARTHWLLGDEQKVDGVDFYVDEHELGHVHLYAEAHVAQSRAIAKALVDAQLAAPFQWSPQFVVQTIDSADDAEAALWLFRVRYDFVVGGAARAH